MTSRLLMAAAVAAALSASSAGAADEPDRASPDVVYTVLFLKDGAVLAAPTVVGRFGQEVRVEVPDLMRVEVSAQAPDADSRSFTTARMSLSKDGAWQSSKVMSMQATLTMTPSFEYSVDGTPYRFVVMPRQVVAAANQAQP
jgi:hypothetical protein